MGCGILPVSSLNAMVLQLELFPWEIVGLLLNSDDKIQHSLCGAFIFMVITSCQRLLAISYPFSKLFFGLEIIVHVVCFI